MNKFCDDFSRKNVSCKKYFSRLMIILACMAVFISITGCSSDNPELLGKWKAVELNGQKLEGIDYIVYEFKKDNKGTCTDESTKKKIPFRYKTEGDKLLMINGEDMPKDKTSWVENTYSISGNKLTIINSVGNSKIESIFEKVE